MKFNTIEEALQDIRAGKMVIVVDDENRENEGDLLMAAEMVSPDAINFMITEGRGLVCLPMHESLLENLGLNQMVTNNTDNHQTAFTFSVDHSSCETGISAYERADTIKELLNPENKLSDFKLPGHIFPLKAKPGGVIQRDGHTEAAVDLARLAGFKQAGVICEIIDTDGRMARLPRLQELATEWDIKLITIETLIEYRNSIHDETAITPENRFNLKRGAKAQMPTRYGNFEMIAYSSNDTIEPHLAIFKGDLAKAKEPILCRIHSECFTGDLLGSSRCDCGDQLQKALRKIQNAGAGVVIYLRQEGRGIGLIEKIKAYELQENGMDTVEANHALGFASDLRQFDIAADILHDLGINSVELLTNNPEKVEAMKKNNIKVTRHELEIEPGALNQKYLLTKKEKMGHLLEKVFG